MRKQISLFFVMAFVAVLSAFSQNRELQLYKGGAIIHSYPVSNIDSVKVGYSLSAPSAVNAQLNGQSVQVSWTSVQSATSYQLYRSSDNVSYSLLAGNVKGTSYTDASPLNGINYYKVKAVGEIHESPLSTASAPVLYNVENDLLAGLYMGIIGFNEDVIDKGEMALLAPNTKSSFISFVNSLTTKKSTVLYYGVDQALDKLTTTSFPGDLGNVAIVTFTDGLDQGSLGMVDYKYSTRDEYRTYLSNRIKSTTVRGLPLSAYTIGLRGGDVTDYEGFQKNLVSLSSSAENATEVTDMSAVNSRFQEIANQLINITETKNMSIKFPKLDDGQTYRFTFDNVSSAAQSKVYIEGTMNVRDNTLNNVRYVGLTCASGTSIQGTAEGKIKVVFDFADVKMADGSSLSLDYINEYYLEGAYWQVNSEFDKGEDLQVSVTRSSAAIMLVLDCSSSLQSDGDKFTEMKSHAKAFIETLAGVMDEVHLASGITLSQHTLTVNAGTTAQLVATVSPSNASNKSVTWTSSNNSVATVDYNGVVTAISAGTCTITATARDGSGVSASCAVTVPKLVSGITLNQSTLNMNVGSTAQLITTVSPSDATNKSVTWSSNNTSVATVNANGLVSAVATGTCTIQATAQDGSGKSGSCAVTVTQLVTSITLNYNSLNINAGAQAQLIATPYPSTASNSSVVWTSSNTGVATVNANGLVTAVSAGTCVIAATAQDGSGVSASCAVTVPKLVSGITLNNSTLTMNNGTTSQLTATVTPADATNTSVLWASSNTAVATVSNAGLVTAVSAGSCSITATAKDGSGVSASCTVTVKQLVTGITLSQSTLKVKTGATAQLTATVSPTNASNSSVSWASSNTSVAKVSNSGLITAVADGTSVITVTANDGSGKSASCTVTVWTDRSGSIDGHDYVDLGLPSGTLWATCNVGATSPEGYGNYYAWGETKTKSDYSSSTYTYSSNPTELPTSVDAAYVNWGSNWRMPSLAQFQELINSSYTTTTWTTLNGYYGRRITSKLNGNSIFLPAAGYRNGSSLYYGGSYGNYWSRTLYTSNTSYAYSLDFSSSYVITNDYNRYYGQSVRPVRLLEQ